MKYLINFLYFSIFLFSNCRKESSDANIQVLNGSIKHYVGTYGIPMQKDPFDFFISFYFDEGNFGKKRFYNSVISTYSDDLKFQIGDDVYQMNKSLDRLELKYNNHPDNLDGLKDFEYFKDTYFSKNNPIALTLAGKEILLDSVFISGPLKFNNLVQYRTQTPSNLYKISKNSRTLNYNASNGNEDGILLTMSYSGVTINSTFEDLQSPRKEPVVRVIHYKKDNGTLELPNDLFKDIPVGAYLTFHINRGLCRKYTINGKSHVIKFAFTNKLMAILAD